MDDAEDLDLVMPMYNLMLILLITIILNLSNKIQDY